MRLATLAAFAAFPLLLYALREVLSAPALIGLFALLACARILMTDALKGSRRLLALLGLGGFALLALLVPGLGGLMFYPVLLSLGAAVYCAYTLRYPPSAIEQLARRTGMDVDATGARYTRGVTWLWLGFFGVNAAIAAWIAVRGDTALWSLYNGLLSYLLVGVLFAGEWLFRGFYRRRLEARS
ncbi:MAG: hypothetical protein AAGI15_10900 [Pseudomonadota bacterium]